MEIIDSIGWGSLGTILLLATAVMGSPGPTTMSLVGVVSAFGPRRSVPYMLGEIIGTTVVLCAVAIGVTATLLALPGLAGTLTMVSVAYIVWLAYRIATAKPAAEATSTGAAPSLGGGMLLGVANPKAWLAIGAVFASGRLSDVPIVDGALKIGVLTAMIIVIHVAWLFAGASLAPLLGHPRRARVLNWILAVLLLGGTMLAVLN